MKTIIATMSVLTAASRISSDVGLFLEIHVISISPSGIIFRYGAAVVLIAWAVSSKIHSILKARKKL